MKVDNFFHWYNGQSPLAYCCMQIHLEQAVNVKGVCICGRTERPRWVIEARSRVKDELCPEEVRALQEIITGKTKMVVQDGEDFLRELDRAITECEKEKAE
jgi:hypothetical protein